MSFRKNLFKVLDVAEIFFGFFESKKDESSLSPAIKAMYDSSYYEGHMSYGESQAWKAYYTRKAKN